MADYVATIHVPAGQVVWPADEVPRITADALHRFEPEPDPVVTRAELRRFTSADRRNRAAGRLLNDRERLQFASKCKAAGLPELTDGLRYRQWGGYLDVFNQDAQTRGWWAGLIPPVDPHYDERLAWEIAAEEHRGLLKAAIERGEIQARKAGTLVPAPAGLVNLQRLVLTRGDLDAFAALLLMQVMSESEDAQHVVAGTPKEHIAAWMEATAPEPAPVVLEQVVPAPAPDPQRRLALLRSLGGDVKWCCGKWGVTGTTALVRHERGRPRSSEKTIRADLHQAAEAERREGAQRPNWHP